MSSRPPSGRVVVYDDDHYYLGGVLAELLVQAGCDAVVTVPSRLSNDAMYGALMAREAEWVAAGIRSVKVLGDASAPGPIAWATYAGHRYARELDTLDIGDALAFRREITALADD